MRERTVTREIEFGKGETFAKDFCARTSRQRPQWSRKARVQAPKRRPKGAQRAKGGHRCASAAAFRSQEHADRDELNPTIFYYFPTFIFTCLVSVSSQVSPLFPPFFVLSLQCVWLGQTKRLGQAQKEAHGPGQAQIRHFCLAEA